MIKLLIGGSPCTFWSIAQKNGRETEAEGMGWELFKNYVIAKEKFKPDFFLYENNKSAAQPIKDSIKKELGVWDETIFMQDTGARYIEINSALVSAQNRQRFYVHNCGEVEQPEDRGILLKDILETGEPRYDKSPYPAKQQVDMIAESLVPFVESKLDSIVDKYGYLPEMFNPYNKSEITDKAPTVTAQGASQTKSSTVMIVQPVNTINGGGEGAKTGLYAIPIKVGEVGKGGQGNRIYSVEGKSIAQTATSGGIGSNTGLYAIRVDEPMRVREATKQGYADINVGECVDLTQPNSKTRRGRACSDKSNCLTTSHNQYEYCGILGYATPIEWDENGTPTKAVSCADGKVYTVYEVKDGQITINGKQYPIKLVDGYYIIRKLTVTECCRLQTLPDDYCRAVSSSQGYKGLGNGWTAEVIIHILNGALKDIPRDEEIVVLSMYDGIGTGRYCLDKMGFTNVKYYAYEIDKYAK